MTKSELAARISRETGLSKADANRFLNAVFQTISTEVRAGGKVTLAPIGTFSPKETPARPGRNPRTGETIEVPAQRTVKFKPAPPLVDLLNEGQDEDEEDEEEEDEEEEEAEPTAKPASKTVRVTKHKSSSPHWWDTYWV
ncbi:MAG: HU family DNA-binding protein [Proteobacteria bacterium]|nr:HU family DNA-binding protein [Pseudomonadota bacterium]